MMACLMPLLVLACLIALKLIFFRSRNTWIIGLLILGMAATAFTFESHFDKKTYEVPLFIVALPVSLILLSFTFLTVTQIFFEKTDDYGFYVFRGYDFTHKKVCAVISFTITVIYCVSETIALYCLEQTFTNAKTGKKHLCANLDLDKAIMKWNLFSSIIYSVMMMEASGSLILNLILD